MIDLFTLTLGLIITALIIRIMSDRTRIIRLRHRLQVEHSINESLTHELNEARHVGPHAEVLRANNVDIPSAFRKAFDDNSGV
jgi:hypothetical protein